MLRRDRKSGLIERVKILLENKILQEIQECDQYIFQKEMISLGWMWRHGGRDIIIEKPKT